MAQLDETKSHTRSLLGETEEGGRGAGYWGFWSLWGTWGIWECLGFLGVHGRGNFHFN